MSDRPVIYESYSGYQNSYINIRTITSWNVLFKGTKKIRFLDSRTYPLEFVGDVVLEANGSLRVGQYFFNAKDTMKIRVELAKEKLTKELKELSTKVGQTIFSVYFETNGGYVILSKDKFAAHFPDYTIKNELFIFLEKQEDEYPPIYCMESNHRKGDLMNVLEVLTYCSMICYLPAGEPTNFGKDFTYALIQNKVVQRVEQSIPNTGNIDLPNNGQSTIRPDYKIDALNKLVDKSHVDNLKVPMKNEPKKVSEKKNSKFTAEQDAIIQGVMEKEEINVSDVMQEGVVQVISMLSDLPFIVDVHMDIPDIAKKGCFFEKKLHILPIEYPDTEPMTNFDFSWVFDTPDENIVVCTEETYPKKSKKNAGKEN